MAPSHRPNYQSDSDDEDDQQKFSGVETNVLLGVADGSIDVKSDLIDAAVSRIGGLPVRVSQVVYYLSSNILTRGFFIFSPAPIICGFAEI